LPDKHIDVIGDIGDSSSVSFGLPEAGFDVWHVALACLNVYLIEGCVDGIGLNFTLGLPEGFDSGMEILTDCIRAGIPETNTLYEVIAKGVIGEGESCVEEAEKVAVMHAGVELVVGACEDWDIQVVAGEDLVWLINKLLSARIVFRVQHVTFKFVNINCGDPAVGVDNCDPHLCWINTFRLELAFLKVLHTPGDVTGFALLLELPDVMVAVAHRPEFRIELSNQLLSLLLRVFLVGLHRQKHHKSGLCAGVHGQTVQRISQ
jgi:hypothetical protein